MVVRQWGEWQRHLLGRRGHESVTKLLAFIPLEVTQQFNQSNLHRIAHGGMFTRRMPGALPLY